ncbi:MAG: hypothetical protein EBX40_02215, partial [Gammaproteobacteria bacterium]|nr:hypothetical protein [Gammaproteobacteria bacterium]
MNVGTNAFNQSATQVTASALQVQNAMRTTGLAYNHANEVITSTGARLQELRAELAFVKAKTKEVNEAIKEGTGNYQGHISQLEQLTVEEERLKTAINEISAAQRTLNKTFNPALEQEQAEVTALANKQLQERNLLLRQQAAAEAAPEGSIAKARATAALYRTELARLNVTTAEGAKRQKELIAEIERLDTFIKANVDKYTAQKINIGNYPQYQEQFANITAALDKMRAKGQENTEEFKSLNTALVELTRSMGGLKGELALVEKEMQSMALAGQKGSAEYKALQARAVELRGAIRQVNADTGASANTFGKFNTILERTGLRMFAMMAVFQVVMSVIKALGDEWSKFIDRLNFKQVTAGKIAEATGNEFLNQAVKMRALRDEFNAAGASVNDRLKVIEKLNSEYEQNGLHLKNMADAEAFFTEKSDKFIKALELRAKAAGALKVVTDNYAQSIKEKADPSATLDEVDKRIFDVIGSFGGATPIASYLSTKKAFANVGENEADRKRQNDEAMRQMVEAQRLANKLDQETGLNSDPSKQKKGATSSEFDYTKAKLDAMNKLREMQAKLVAERIKQEAAANKEIADNEQNSLTDRLVGYAIYARDRKELLRNEQEAELQQVRNKIDQIAAIEAAQAKKKAGQKLTKDESVMFDGKGKLRSSEQTLLLNRDALSTEYDYLTQKFRTANAELAREIDNDLAKITASSMRQALDQTEEELEKTLTAIQERANNLTAGVLASGVRGDRKQRRLQGINQNTAIERDLAEIGANQQQQQQVQADIAELQRKGEHNAAMLALEAEYQKKLIDLKKQGASL